MATLSLGAIPLAGDDAFARQRMLRRRMRALAAAGFAAFAAVTVIAATAYPSTGFSGAALLFGLGAAVVFEGVRQADRHYIAPLLARCQEDFSRQIAALFGPIQRREPLAQGASQPVAGRD